MLRTLVLVFVLCVSCSSEQNPASDPSGSNPVFYPSHEPKKLNAPFSDIVQVGDFWFLSGQIGMDHSSRTLIKGGIKAETRQCLENIKAVLEQYDLEMNQVVKALVVLDSIEHFAAFNEVYQEYFPHKPARTTFAAEKLAAGALVEIEVTVAD